MKMNRCRKNGRYQRREKKSKFILLTVVFLMILLMGLIGCKAAIETQTMEHRIFVYGQEVSALTPEQAAEKIAGVFEEKQVSFNENGKSVYKVSLKDLGYSLNRDALKCELSLLEKEPLKKGGIFQSKQERKVPFETSRDDKKFAEGLSEDHFRTDAERTGSEDAYIRYDEETKKFVIVGEKQGNEIDEKKLLENTSDSIQKSLNDDFGRSIISVEINKKVYKQAAVTASSDELTSRLGELNSSMEKYRKATVTYLFGNVTETLDSDRICSWLIVSDDKVELDSDKVRAYIKELADKYDTLYVPRSFQTSNGQTVTISNNEYGFRIDKEGEFQQLCKDLQSGTTVQREPVYDKKGLTRNGTDDLNGSYIEVSLEQQHLWLYKNGGLVTETDIISGLPTAERATYTGAYEIAYKASPFTLASDIYGYEVPVNYWMPFVDGQGLHDAGWQSQFGGDVYKTNGSHGCVNLPPAQAEIIYNAIDGGYPIILY